MITRLKRLWFCQIRGTHRWDATLAEARKSLFLRTDCEFCGRSLDAAKLVRMTDKMRRDSWVRDRLVAGFPDAYDEPDA
jgi:hypothetical protein